jgi:hypothetical protein
MKAFIAIIIGIVFLLPWGCTKPHVKKEKPEFEEPKEDEDLPPWATFDDEKEEDEEE